MRVELPEGQWAEVSEVSDLRDGDRKAVNRSFTLSADADGLPKIPGDTDDKMTDALLVRICHNWSLPFPPPDQDTTSLDKLTIPQGKALREGIAEHLALVKDEVNPSKPDTDPTGASST
jgi:hypothetical protein